MKDPCQQRRQQHTGKGLAQNGRERLELTTARTGLTFSPQVPQWASPPTPLSVPLLLLNGFSVPGTVSYMLHP
jgi:hypothetical protein